MVFYFCLIRCKPTRILTHSIRFMPIQQNTQVEGRIGDMIFYQSKGQFLIRKKGGTGRQAEAARRQSGIMGKASALSAAIRKAVRPILPASTEPRQLMYRLNNALQTWLRIGPENGISELPSLEKFSCSAEEPFHIAMKVQRTPEGGLVLRIPAFESGNPIAPLPFHGVIDLKLVAVSCPLDEPGKARVVPAGLTIPYAGMGLPARDLHLPVQTREGYLTVVWLTVNGLSSGVVGAFFG